MFVIYLSISSLNNQLIVMGVNTFQTGSNMEFCKSVIINEGLL